MNGVGFFVCCLVGPILGLAMNKVFHIVNVLQESTGACDCEYIEDVSRVLWSRVKCGGIFEGAWPT